MKLKGCCVPDRVFTDDERAHFEEMTFQTLEKELQCSDEKPSKILPGCEVNYVRIESESIVDSKKKKNPFLEVIITVEAQADSASGNFPTLVTTGLEGLLDTLHSPKNEDYFDGVESLEVYYWGESSHPLDQYLVAAMEENGKLNMDVSSSQTEEQGGAFILSNGLGEFLIIASLFFICALAVQFLKSNKRSKVQSNAMEQNIPPPVERYDFQDFNPPQRPMPQPRVEHTTKYLGMMDDNFDDYEDEHAMS